jgi:hypothetical protein
MGATRIWPGQRRMAAVAGHQRHGRGEVAAGFFAGQVDLRALAGQLGALLVEPLERGVAGLHRVGEAMLGASG